jgi:bile acid:Na+ symporter, BASS family
MTRWWRNRDFILILSVFCGLLLGQGATWTKPLVLPAPALVMTLSTMGVRRDALRSGQGLWRPVLSGLLLNSVMLGGVLLGLSFFMISEAAMIDGFVLLVAVPPAIAVIPFTNFLQGNTAFSLLGTVACYLGALVITPCITLAFFGTGFIEPWSLITIIAQLILVPLILARILLWSPLGQRLETVKGTIINWSFFLVMYTIVGFNREFFFTRPFILLPVVVIAVASTFMLEGLIEKVGRFMNLDRLTLTSLVLLGSLKKLWPCRGAGFNPLQPQDRLAGGRIQCFHDCLDHLARSQEAADGEVMPPCAPGPGKICFGPEAP